MKRIGIICHVDNPSPALSAALQELVKAAGRQLGYSEGQLKVVEQPPYEGGGAEEHPAHYSANDSPQH